MRIFKIIFIATLIAFTFFCNQAFAKYYQKDVVLFVKGKQYSPKDKIKVRPGQIITIKAKFIGGSMGRNLNPHESEYVKVISNTDDSLVSYGSMNGGTRREYKLISETINITPRGGIKVLSVNGNQAALKMPDSDVNRASISLSDTLKWNYTCIYVKTGRVSINREDKESAMASFYFELGDTLVGSKEDISKPDTNKFDDDTSEEKQWFTSKNITVIGTENNMLRGRLNDLQNLMNSISQNMLDKNHNIVNKQLPNLIIVSAGVDSYVKELKRKTPNFKCSIIFKGKPSDGVMNKVIELENAKTKLKELAMIAQGNHDKVNNMLIGTQDVFSANILKSVFKNYLNWSGALPTDATAGLASYSTNTGLADLPRTFTSWYQDAKSDSSILRNQARKVRALTDLREFYLQKDLQAVAARKVINDELKSYQPETLKNIDKQLEIYFSSLSWASWKPSIK